MSSGVALPFYTNRPSAYLQGGASTATTSTPSSSTSDKKASAADAKSSSTADIVDIRVPLPGRSFTADAGDSFSLRELYDAGPKAFDTIGRYRVALRDDAAAGGGGRLMLDGKDVTDQVDFSPMEFNSLLFVAGPQGSKQDLVVVARAGKPDGQGGLTGIVDSPAVQISASVTGTRSINAAGALRTDDIAPDEARFLKVAREAEIFSGINPASRPALSATIQPDDPSVSLEMLPFALGAFQSTANNAGTAAASSAQPASLGLQSLYTQGIGGSTLSRAPAVDSKLRALMLLLESSQVGGLQFGGGPTTNQSQLASQAYLKSYR